MLSDINPNWKIFDEEEDGKRWEALNKKAEDLTKGTYETWKEELQNLLIFAGLFSAVVTAFAIEAGKTVQGDPADTTVLLLRAIALQINNQSSPQANLPIDLNPEPIPSLYSQQINILYSVSLTLSLAVVMGGIVCLQWLREFGKNITGVSHKDDLSLQYQRHESLQRWGVFGILNALPLLLLIALSLFFTGFMVSQWKSNALAAIPVTCVVALSGIFILITTILPASQVIWLTGKSSRTKPPVLCPYRSPQAWLFHRLLQVLLYLVKLFGYPEWLKRFNRIRSWVEYDTSTQGWKENAGAVQSIYRALFWISREYRQTNTIVLDAYLCMLLASCHGSWTKLKEKYAPGKNVKWVWDRLDLLSRFERDVKINTTEVFWNIRVKAVIDATVEWNRSDLSLARHDASSLRSDIDITALDSSIRNWTLCADLVKDITNGLLNPENTWITEENAAAAVCHVINQGLWFETIPILVELCKRYQKGNRSIPIQQLCNKLREKLGAQHKCEFLVGIFNQVFPHVDNAHLHDLGTALGSLLVRCDQCFIFYYHAEEFLKIIEQLASQRLIIKEPHSLDDIFLYTAHNLQYSYGLHRVLPAIEKTLNTILSAAEDYVQLPEAATNSVLHPSRFTISRTVPDPRFAKHDLKPIWDLIDNFNMRLKDIWARREVVESGQESAQGNGIGELVRSLRVIVETDELEADETSTQIAPNPLYETHTDSDGLGIGSQISTSPPITSSFGNDWQLPSSDTESTISTISKVGNAFGVI